MSVLVRHDPACRYAREDGGGHSDAAKRLFDGFNLHRIALHQLVGIRGWVAVSLADGTVSDDVYDTRAEAVAGMFPNEDRYGYLRLRIDRIPTICVAASLLMMQRMEASFNSPDRDQPHGGRQIIWRNSITGRENQLRAIQSGQGMIALGYGKE